MHLGGMADSMSYNAAPYRLRREPRRNFRPIRALIIYPPNKMENPVDREHIKGAADKAKGAIKDAAGKLTGDKKLQAEGKMDKAKGDLHDVAGDVKDAARDASKSARKN